MEVNYQKFQYSLTNFEKILSFSLYATGIFALLGALYTWGDGFLFSASPETDISIFLADLLITAPISFVAGYGIGNQKKWGILAGWMIAGIYIYGSMLVYISVLQQNPPYPVDLIIPPIFGMVLSLGILIWSWRKIE